MIITKTPFRISFAGGGSDLPSFYESHGGAVLSATINQYMYLIAHPFAEKNKIQLKYSKVEYKDRSYDLEHPIVKAALKRFDIVSGIEIASFADIPAGTGLASSSSFTVGLLQCLSCYKNRLISKEEMAHTACDIEINELKEPIGKQDQYSVAYGGLNHIVFKKNGEVEVNPVPAAAATLQELSSRLFLIYTGQTRRARDILSDQAKNLGSNHEQVSKMVDLASDIRSSIVKGSLDDVGSALHEAWELKKRLSGAISAPKIDELYQYGIKEAGATGGKLLGAGGGGYILFYCPPENQEKFKEKMRHLEKLDFSFEYNGSSAIYIGR